MIEHKPWKGPKRELGIDGQRVAIVGYSHYRNAKDADNEQFTICVVRNVLSGQQRGDSLFAAIPGYFGFKDRIEFWKRVWFFNFIPECIGTDEEKYATGSPDQIKRAGERFRRILQKERIQKAFVFTTKGWRHCPYTDEEKKGKDCASLGHGFDDVTWGNYTLGARKVLAFGFRHPQFAPKEHMRAAVSEALTRRLS